jgi:outer membrane protein
VNRQLVWLPLVALGATVAALGQAQPSKVGVINIQSAIISTKDGQKAATELATKYEPRRKQIEARSAEVGSLKERLSKGANTISEDAKQGLVRDIDQKTRSLQRDTEDAQTEFDQEQNRVLQELGQKIMAVIDKYARDNGFVLILDVGAQQNPVLYASNNIDITNEIVALYDKNAPSAATPAAPAAPAVRPVAAPLRPATKK